MTNINDNKEFWNKTAKLYKKATYTGNKEQRAYDTMAQDIAKYINRNMEVLELACGPGMLSHKIAAKCKFLEATDFSAEMIAEAKKQEGSSRLHFSVQDATKLPYGDETFDGVVMTNALHIMPYPEKALAQIHRVLKKDGIFLCPTFTRENQKHGLKERIMELAGFKTYSRWSHDDLIEYLKTHHFYIVEAHVITGHNFPITFVAAQRK